MANPNTEVIEKKIDNYIKVKYPKLSPVELMKLYDGAHEFIVNDYNVEEASPDHIKFLDGLISSISENVKDYIYCILLSYTKKNGIIEPTKIIPIQDIVKQPKYNFIHGFLRWKNALTLYKGVYFFKNTKLELVEFLPIINIQTTILKMGDRKGTHKNSMSDVLLGLKAAHL